MQDEQPLSDPKSFYEMTKFPDIFMKSYWGTHLIYDDDSTQGKGSAWEEIFAARNLFILQYEIKCHVNSETSQLKLLSRHVKDPFPIDSIESKLVMDHIEYYQSNRKWIMLCSPYSQTINSFEGAHEVLLSCGWRLTTPMYDPSATTYIKVMTR